MAKLETFCSINMGQSPDSATYNTEGKGLPFFQGNADFGNIHPKVRVWCSAPTKVANAEDILISVRAPIGALNIASEKCCIGRGLAALTVDSSLCEQKYLWYGLESKIDELNAKGTGSTFKAINKKSLAETEICLPPLDEQRRIAAVLGKVTDLIAQRHAQLDKLDLLVKSRFVELFGDLMLNSHHLPVVPLGSILTVEPQNGLYKPQSDYVSDGQGVPILRIDSFYGGKVSNLKSLKRLICSDAELKKYSLHENDIVINRVNSIEYLGKCGLIQGLIEDTVFESNMMRLHIDETKFDPIYMTRMLCSEFIHQQIMKRAKKAVNQASINQKDVQSFTVYMPPLEIQKRFAAFVAQIDKSKVCLNTSLNEMKKMKESLMQQYFR